MNHSIHQLLAISKSPAHLVFEEKLFVGTGRTDQASKEEGHPGSSMHEQHHGQSDHHEGHEFAGMEEGSLHVPRNYDFPI